MNIAIFTYPLAGHVNPLINIIKKLDCMNNKVTVFTSKKYKSVFQEINCKIILYPEFLDRIGENSCKNLEGDFWTRQIDLKYLRAEKEHQIILCTELLNLLYPICIDNNPDIIMYDSMAVWGVIFAKKRDICCIEIEMATFMTTSVSQQIYHHYFEEVIQKETCKSISFSGFIQTIKRLEKELLDSFSILIDSERRRSFLPNAIITNSCKKLQICEEKRVPIYYLGSNIMPDEKIKKEDNRVFISRGTIYDQYNLEVMDKIVQSICHKDYKIIVTCGKTDLQLPNINNCNVRYYKYVDQLLQIQKSEVFISHGGLTGIIESIHMNRPIIIFPSNFHGYQVGLAVEENNIGILLHNHPFDGQELKMALHKIHNKKIQQGLIRVREELINQSRKDLNKIVIEVFQKKNRGG